MNRHFEAKHAGKYANFSSEERAKKADKMVAQMKKELSVFSKQSASQDGITRVSYVIAHKIAKNSKPFSEGEFIKECMVDSAGILCPDKKKLFENISLSMRTVVRRVEDISGNLNLQLKNKASIL